MKDCERDNPASDESRLEYIEQQLDGLHRELSGLHRDIDTLMESRAQLAMLLAELRDALRTHARKDRRERRATRRPRG